MCILDIIFFNGHSAFIHTYLLNFITFLTILLEHLNNMLLIVFYLNSFFHINLF